MTRWNATHRRPSLRDAPRRAATRLRPSVGRRRLLAALGGTVLGTASAVATADARTGAPADARTGVANDAASTAAVAQDGDGDDTDPDGLDVTLVEADPDAGFEFPYYLYAPPVPSESGASSADAGAESTTPARPLLVCPNDAGEPADDVDVHREAAASAIGEAGRPRQLADQLSVPLLVPVFPRPGPGQDEDTVPQALDRATLQIDDGPLERVDLQLRRMIADARERLDEHGHPTLEEVALHGVGVAGHFANRFALLHPDIVSSVSVGGYDGVATLPREELAGRELPYPIGVADLPDLIGREFDRRAAGRVDQLLYVGTVDDATAEPGRGTWSDDLVETALAVYGEHLHDDRVPVCEEAYYGARLRADFRTVADLSDGPAWVAESELLQFHERYAGRTASEATLRFRSPPSDGADDVALFAATPWETDELPLELRVLGSNGADLTRSPTPLLSAHTFEGSEPLVRSLFEGETLTAALLPSGADGLDAALATAEAAVVRPAVLGFAADLEPGQRSVRVDVSVTDARGHEALDVRLFDETGEKRSYGAESVREDYDDVVGLRARGSLEPGEVLVAAALPPGEDDLDDAIASASTVVAGGVADQDGTAATADEGEGDADGDGSDGDADGDGDEDRESDDGSSEGGAGEGAPADGLPGFGVGAAVGGLGGALSVLRRRLRDDDRQRD